MIKKIAGGFIILFYKLYYYKRLKIVLPSISFTRTPFLLFFNSSTIIGEKAIIGKESQIINKGIITIGNNFCLNNYSRIVSHENVVIGNNVTIAQFVSVLDHDHAYIFDNNEMKLKGYITAPIFIGNNVWIADKVTICKGVKIGDNVIIGANSVVTKDIENNSIAAGIPCVKIKNI
jgi:maltose O-acetyltransferase